MSIIISSKVQRNYFDGFENSWLLANVGDRIVQQIQFSVGTFAIASTDDTIFFGPTDGYLEPDHLVSKIDAFAEFEVGDTVVVSRTAGSPFNATITHKISDSDIRLSTLNGITGESTAALIFNTTPIKAIEFLYNFVENDVDNDFISAVDGNITKYNAPIKLSNDTSTTIMIPQGSQSWNIGTAQIIGTGVFTNGGVEYYSRYSISITTFVTEFMIASQLADINARVKPNKFKNAKCLKNIFRINAYYDYQNPNRVITRTENDTLGNSGWFGENFNGGGTNYTSSNLVFKKADNTVIPSLELNNSVQKFSFDIDSVTPTFSSTASVIQVGMFKLMNAESEHKNTGFPMAQNYAFDWLYGATTILTPPLIQGIYGNALRNVTINYVNANKVNVSGTIQFNGNSITAYNLSDVPQFALYCGAQDKLLFSPFTDRQNVLVCTKEFYTDNTDPNLLVPTTKFLKHYENDLVTDGAVLINTFPEDEVVASTIFYVDKAGRTADAIKIKTIGCKIKAKNSITNEEFTLQNYSYNISGASLVNGNQFIDVQINTPLHIPANEIRKYIKIKRRVDLDTATKFYYEFNYPFLMRWEYFKELQGVNGAFFDTTKPFNGFNHFWHRYTTQPNWNVYFEFNSTVVKNFNNLTFKSSHLIETNDWNSNTNFVANEVATYDKDTNAQLINGSQKFIEGYKQTKVIASFNKIIGTVDLTKTFVVVRIEVYEVGGIDGSTRISTIQPKDLDTIFISPNSNGTALLYNSSNTIYAECLIDNEKLPNNTRFKISARVYEKPIRIGKQFEFGDFVDFENGDAYNFEFQ